MRSAPHMEWLRTLALLTLAGAVSCQSTPEPDPD